MTQAHIPTYTTNLKNKKKQKHAYTHGHMCVHTPTHTQRYKCTLAHTNTDTDATEQQQLKQRPDDNYCSCGVDAWRKCLWTADERRGWSTVRWHHALNTQTAVEFLQSFNVAQQDADAEVR